MPSTPVWLECVRGLQFFISPQQFPHLNEIIIRFSPPRIPGPDTVREFEALVPGVLLADATEAEKSSARRLIGYLQYVEPIQVVSIVLMLPPAAVCAFMLHLKNNILSHLLVKARVAVPTGVP